MRLINLARGATACRAGYRYLVIAILSASVSALVFSKTVPRAVSPGLEPYTPTRIDWLTTTLQADLRDDELQTNGFYLQITSPDQETILIYVVYESTVNREAMNITIDAARQAIQMAAKRYGWDKWVRIREERSACQVYRCEVKGPRLLASWLECALRAEANVRANEPYRNKSTGRFDRFYIG